MSHQAVLAVVALVGVAGGCGDHYTLPECGRPQYWSDGQCLTPDADPQPVPDGTVPGGTDQATAVEVLYECNQGGPRVALDQAPNLLSVYVISVKCEASSGQPAGWHEDTLLMLGPTYRLARVDDGWALIEIGTPQAATLPQRDLAPPTIAMQMMQVDAPPYLADAQVFWPLFDSLRYGDHTLSPLLSVDGWALTLDGLTADAPCITARIRGRHDAILAYAPYGRGTYPWDTPEARLDMPAGGKQVDTFDQLGETCIISGMLTLAPAGLFVPSVDPDSGPAPSSCDAVPDGSEALGADAAMPAAHVDVVGGASGGQQPPCGEVER